MAGAGVCWCGVAAHCGASADSQVLEGVSGAVRWRTWWLLWISAAALFIGLALARAFVEGVL